MELYEILRVSLTSLRANKLRSSLTILGIIVGIFSIIAISTIIAMLRTSIEEGVSSLGSNTFQIQKWPAVRIGGHGEWAKYRNRKNITTDNFDDLEEKLIESKAVSATSGRGGRVVKYGNEKTNPNVSIYGVTPSSFITRDWNVESGRAINKPDYKSGKKVVVLGTDLLKTLFKNKNIDPIGEEVSVNGKRLKIIGILEEQGAIFGQSKEILQ